MAEKLKPDICVIGAGAGGLSVAAAAAAFGVSVVLIEKGRMGGDCLNYGCVPSKALIAAAKRASACAMSGALGIDAHPKVDFSRTYHHVHKVIAAVAPNDSAERFAGLGVQVIAGVARFTDPATGVKIRPTGYCHSIPEVLAAAEAAGFQVEEDVVGQDGDGDGGVLVRDVDERLGDVLGVRAKKWVGVRVWFGVCFSKKP